MKTNELLKLADGAYYAAQYDKAIELYKQVLDADPKNKYALEQLGKAEFNRPLQTVTPEIPTEALQLYRRARSFISAGELPQAKKLLIEAISFAEKEGIDFTMARALLDNLTDAFTAEGFKKKAIEELNTQQWVRAEGSLNTAIKLDPTDDAIQTLFANLSDLLKAEKLINQLGAGTKDKKTYRNIIVEVETIIKKTEQTVPLSKLWLKIVRLEGKTINKKLEKDNIFRSIVWTVLSYTAVLIILISLVYLLPSNNIILDCNSAKNNLEVVLKYPSYIANGDTEQIKIYVTNISKSEIKALVSVHFQGPAKVGLDSNVFKFDILNPGEQKSETINFFLLEPLSLISSPDHYINFGVSVEGNNVFCTPDNLHIAISPIYSLRKLVNLMWGTIGITMIGLFWERLKKLLGFQ